MLPENPATKQAIDQREPLKRIAIKVIDDGYVESADEFVRFVDSSELFALYSARRFKDLRCPICRTFGCGGC